MADYTKRNRRRLRVGVAYAILAFAAVPAAAAADAEDPRYVLGVIEDTAYAETIIDGDYATAIAAIDTKRRHLLNRFYAANNLCVALVAARDFDRAAPVCNGAVEMLQPRAKAVRRGSAAEYARLTAIALSNRGVMHALNGDEGAARSDFGAARELGARLEAPRVNLAKLDTAGAASA
ncbi:MAG: hypothetical protein R3176_06920 [Woeseiaceae bacterium]|nr:hypothetical protein [Woeseiaceae bacterium]